MTVTPDEDRTDSTITPLVDPDPVQLLAAQITTLVDTLTEKLRSQIERRDKYNSDIAQTRAQLAGARAMLPRTRSKG